MTKIDTSTEAVERLALDHQTVGDNPDTLKMSHPHHWKTAAVLRQLLKERDEARARVRALEEITDPDFIWGAMDNVHDMDVTLDDYAKAVSRAQRAALAASPPADPVTNAGCRQPVKVTPSPDEHYDDYCIRQFAKLMSEKMAASRAKGRSGWNDPERCSIEYLRSLLYEHLDKGDPVDVANFCMMLRHYEASTYREFCNCTPQPSPADPVTNAACRQQMKAKPLVWEHGRNRLQMDNTMMVGKGYDFDTMELTRQEGYGFGCGYIIWAIRSGLGKKSWNVYGTLDGIFIQDIASEDAAKDAAQADYEARILAALEASPHVNETPKSEHDGADVLTAPVTLADALKVPEVQAVVVTLQYTLKLCEDGHPVSAKNLAHACLRAIGEGEA